MATHRASLRLSCFRRWGLAALLVGLVLTPAVGSAAPAFIARAEKTRVAAGEPFAVEVTLSIQTGGADGYKAPPFEGLRVLAETPSRSTQIQMGGGGTFAETVYTWRYELEAAKPGAFTIGAARIRVDGRELRTTPISITVTSDPPPTGRSAGRPLARGIPGFGNFPFGDPADVPAPRGGEPRSFVRVVPSKSSAYVGEQLTVEWFLYITERQDKYQAVAEPRTDGFWVEELPLPNNQRGLSLSRQEYEGQMYLVAPLMKKALFPLAPGRLTITPLEAEISQVDFFGSTVRTQRVKADPLTIDAIALPTAGQPPGFDPAAVGKLGITARVDRDRVAVGDAVTLTVQISGQGNLRKLPTPALDRPEGWKVYDPKVSLALEPTDMVAGTKTIEYLLLPERAGVTMLPAVVLPTFDPEARAYVTQKSAPLRLEVVGEAAPAPSGSGPAAAPSVAGIENVIGLDVRPPRRSNTLRRDVGATLYSTRAFLAAVVVPPLALALAIVVGRVREHLGRETERGRRRKLRRLARRRLRLAERHLEEGRGPACFLEIDRVLREFLSGKLGRQVTGLSRDELRALLLSAGLAPELAQATLETLEECDRARFAPGDVSTEEAAASLDRAGDVITRIEKTKLEGEVRA